MSRYPFPSVPDGWFSIGSAEDIAVGDVVTRHYLDRELVAFRGDDGVTRVFDAHCPHLGAHLGVGGTVCGDGIVCPFHGWRFAGDGHVVDVPRLDRAPRISAGTWESVERNGRLFVWHHASGDTSSYDVRPYRAEGEGWTPWRVNTYQVRIHVQELTENIIDRSHFYEVHDMAPPDNPRHDVSFDGPTMTVDQNIKITAMSEEGIEVTTRTTAMGPGVVAVEVQERPLDMLTYITQTPIDDEQVEIAILFSMKGLEDEAATEAIAKLNADLTNLQFTQDVPIWENKIYRDRPPVTRADGPIAQYRRWFRQFYSTWTPAEDGQRLALAPDATSGLIVKA